MRKMSMAMRAELVAAVGERYRSADRESKGRVLDEFVAVTGFHRKHAMRLLRALRSGRVDGTRPGRRIYDEAVRTALVVLWESSDRLCGKRLRPLIPILLEAMERHGHLDVAPDIKTKLTAMSAATIDRALREAKAGSRRPRRRGVAGTELRRSVPIRTFDDWDDPAPGYVEADLVSHSGPVAKGSFAWTFTLTDIATGWTECAPLLVREQTVLVAVLAELRTLMPFPLLGFDTDNDSVFINETVRDYCASAGITFTRCRPYRKNDQAWVEQKNGSIVRRLVGYRRFEGLSATAALADLYVAARLFVNFFQVINIGSIGGLHVPGWEAYSYGASKAALHHLTRALAKRLGKEGICVNAIAPGPFPSRMHDVESEATRRSIDTCIPLGRAGTSKDMEGLAVFLASQASAYVNGVTIPLDGGYISAL